MNILILMIPLAMILGIGFVMAFMWASSQGQFDDLETPAHRMLLDENERKTREHTK